jgi:hypothetical protein
MSTIPNAKILQEQEKAAEEAEARERDIAHGNPLLNPVDFNVKRRFVFSLIHSISLGTCP